MKVMKVNLKLFETAEIDVTQENTYVSPVNAKFIEKLNQTLKKYTDGKKNLESKIIENDKWYRSQHWDIIRGNGKDTDPEPVTAFLFNALANKHADAMDYYPEPNILEREENDAGEAKSLSEIIPIVVEQNNFRKTYSNAWWYKLKQGCAPYGVFWNSELENGLGNIDIQKLDLLNIYWESGITDIQKSPYLFIVSLVDDEMLFEMYPEVKGQINEVKPLDIKSYVTDDTVDLTGKSLIVDAYYKRISPDGKQIVHLTKFVDNIPLTSTEDDPETAATGLYEHGMYPVIFDVLFPEESTPIGFGYIDIVKNPQMYVDKLDQIISKNALISGKYRTIVKENGAINETELADLSKDIIHSKGSVREGEDFAIIQGKPIANFIVNHRINKIEELKETAGNRDFQQGGTNGGVTAYAAIAALQEAGNKLSRDMIGDSYNVYTQIIYMCIELVRQFYDEPRSFRVEDNAGKANYVVYKNTNLKEQEIPPTYEGEEPKYRKPIFDIKVKPEKASPFAREAQNEMAKELFNIGFFNPQRAVEAKIALELMMFEGKEKVMSQIIQNGDLFTQLQEATTKLQQQNDIMMGMNEVIKQTTGRDMLSPNGMAVQQNGGVMNGQG